MEKLEAFFCPFPGATQFFVEEQYLAKIALFSCIIVL
jgi:hypothetical protein